MRPAVRPEFSRLVRADDLGPAGRNFAEVADEGERAALATRFGLIELSRLRVSGTATLTQGGTVVLLSAHLRADAMQECVVTLAPVVSCLDVDFARLYAADAPGEWDAADRNGDGNGGGDIHLDGDYDDIDPMAGGYIDVGEAAAEQLALELDPYPRAPGTTFAPASVGDDRDDDLGDDLGDELDDDLGDGPGDDLGDRRNPSKPASPFAALNAFRASRQPTKRRK